MQWRDQHDAVFSYARFSLRRFVASTRGPKLLCDNSQALDGGDELGGWVSHQ